ncbi:MAG TPA: hypothetical protein VMN60_05010 [Longimicrobiales bacterium]|nr:hypothetical protein [Longimicrobiales bacterium]
MPKSEVMACEISIAPSQFDPGERLRMRAYLACVVLAVCVVVAFGWPQGRISLARELFIDGTAHDLVPIRWVTVAPNGTIAVAQEHDFAVRFFGANGQNLGSVGRRGSGPGEFQSLLGAGWVADTLWVHDRTQSRVSLIVARTTHRSGRMLAAATLTASGRTTEFRDLTPLALYAGGAMFVAGSVAGLPAGHPDRNARAHLIIDSAGVVQRQLLSVPPPAVVEIGTAGAMLPFPNPTLAVTDPDGRKVATATATVAGPGAGTFRVLMQTTRGDTVYMRSYRFRGAPVERAYADSVIDARVRGLQQRNPELAAALRRAAAVPEFHPPLRSLILGRDGALWIRIRADAPTDPRYVLLDPAGSLVGSLIVPDGVTIVQGTGTAVWTIEENADDIESVGRYRVVLGR